MKPDHIFVAIDRDAKELASIRTNPDGDVLATYTDKVCANLSLDDIRKHFTNIILSSRFDQKPIFVAHNAELVKSILGLKSNRAWICTSQLAWPLIYNDMVVSRNLDSVAKHFGINESNVDVTTEVAIVMKVYWEMMRRYKTALFAEQSIRKVGGEHLESVRRFMGF